MKTINHLLLLALLFITFTPTIEAADLISPFRKNASPVEVVVDYEEYGNAVSNILKQELLVVTNQVTRNALTNFLSPLSLKGKTTSSVELVSFWDRPNLMGAANAFRKRGYRSASVPEMVFLLEGLSSDQLPVATASFCAVGSKTCVLYLGIEEGDKKAAPKVKVFNPTDWSLIRGAQWAFVKTENGNGNELTQIIEIDGIDGNVVGEWRGLELTIFGKIPADDGVFLQAIRPRISNYFNSVSGQALLHKYGATTLFDVRRNGNKITLSPSE